MSGHHLELVANVSLLYGEVPLLQRFSRARAAGFRSVETWWPFGASPAPSAADVAAYVEAIDEAGVLLTGMNLFAGDMGAGDRGVVSRPDRTEDLEISLDTVVEVSRRTGCRFFNALYGQRVAGYLAAEQDDVAMDNLVRTLDRLEEIDGTLLIEPLALGLNGAYPIVSAAQALELVGRVRARAATDRIGFLFDTFHLASNSEDVVTLARELAPLIAHVQLADFPGRGAPGTGRIDFAAIVEALWDGGYRGRIAAEYQPGADTDASLSWLRDLPSVVQGIGGEATGSASWRRAGEG